LLVLLLALSGPACATVGPTQRESEGVAYDDRGSGFPIVLLSATGLDRRLWDEQVDRLARTHRVIRLDPRGFGGSQVPHSPFDARADIARVLDDLDLPEACIFGQSGAAALALDFALEAPDRVVALALVAPGMSGYPFPVEELERFRRIERAAESEGHAAAVEFLMRDPYLAGVSRRPRLARRVRRILLESEEMWNPDLARFAQSVAEPAIERLSEVSVPTLVLVGDRDLEHIRDIANRLEEGIDGARLVVVREAGHVLPLERPRQLSRLLAELAQRSCRPRGSGGSSP
jgi:pimeloyl-ACP methyl ester carboxylesterase